MATLRPALKTWWIILCCGACSTSAGGPSQADGDGGADSGGGDGGADSGGGEDECAPCTFSWDSDVYGTVGPLNGIWGFPGGDLFAVGDDAVLRRGAGEWEVMDAPGVHGDALWGSSSSDLWAGAGVCRYGSKFTCSGGAALYHWDGDTWSLWEHGEGALRDVWATAGGNAFAAGEAGALLRREGEAWRPVPVPAAAVGDQTFDVFGAWAPDGEDLWLAGGYYYFNGWSGYSYTVPSLAHFSDGAWTVHDVEPTGGSSPLLIDIWGTSSADVYAVGSSTGSSLGGGDRGRIYHYDGTSWATVAVCPEGYSVTSPSGAYLGGNIIWGTGPEDVYVPLTREPTGDGTCGLWHYDGAAWHVDAVEGCDRPVSAWGSGPDDVYLAVWSFDTGTWLLHGDGSGWARAPDDGFDWLDGVYFVWGTGPDDVYAGGFGSLWRFDGTAWGPEDVGGCEVRSMSGTAGDVTLVCADGEILRNRGDGWESEHEAGAPCAAGFSSIWGSGPDDVYGVCQGPHLFHFDGERWSAMGNAAEAAAAAASASPDAIRLHGISGLGPDDVWISGTAIDSDGSMTGASVVARFDGTSWSASAAPGSGLLRIRARAPGDVFAAGIGDSFVRYDGTAWAQIPCGDACEDSWSTPYIRAIVGVEDGRVLFGSGNYTMASAAGYDYTGTLGVLAYDGVALFSETEATSVYGLWAGACGDVWGVGRYGYDTGAIVHRACE